MACGHYMDLDIIGHICFACDMFILLPFEEWLSSHYRNQQRLVLFVPKKVLIQGRWYQIVSNSCSIVLSGS